MTADVRIRSTPLVDEAGTFFLCILFPFQSAMLCFPPYALTRAHSDAAPPCRTSARARSAISLLRGGRACWRRVRSVPSGDSTGKDVLREMWVDMEIREYSVVRRRAPSFAARGRYSMRIAPVLGRATPRGHTTARSVFLGTPHHPPTRHVRFSSTLSPSSSPPSSPCLRAR
jgi:hypothetical protein